jgi:hypothetical protein
MSGAQFLARVRQTAPDTIRMLLTGHADLNAAMEAVNEGNIFRFLTKPCEKEVLGKAITTGLVQYRLVIAEKELLENTLMGSIKVLTDVLAAASPEAFGRSKRIARYVRHLVSKFGLGSPWRFEAAAMLSQLGCVTLDPEVVQAEYVGKSLSPEDHARFLTHPQVAKDLLVNIPRLEPVAWMISQQLTTNPIAKVPETQAFSGDVAPGARMLKLAVAFDTLRMRGISEVDSIARLRSRHTEFEKELVDAIAEMKTDEPKMELRKIAISKLVTGMILHQEIRNRTGMLVVPNGQEVTYALLIKLENFLQAGKIEKEVMAMVPV